MRTMSVPSIVMLRIASHARCAPGCSPMLCRVSRNAWLRAVLAARLRFAQCPRAFGLRSLCGHWRMTCALLFAIVRVRGECVLEASVDRVQVHLNHRVGAGLLLHVCAVVADR